MSDDTVRVLASLLILGLEWWLMQPATPPLGAQGWLALSRASGSVARRAGQLSLHAEYQYYCALGGST